MTHVGFKYYIAWHTEYSNPPEGKPRVMDVMFESLEQREARMKKGEPSVPLWFSYQHVFGDGYCVCIQSICTPSKMIPKETLSSIRHKRLTRRVTAKYPLLAEQIISEEIMLNKAYYDGVTDAGRLLEHEKAIKREHEIYQEYLDYIKEHS